jgi:hypothetical protein
VEYSSFGSRFPAKSIVVGETALPDKIHRDVLDVIVGDLLQPDQALRDFMKKYGADAPASRTSFSSLVAIWIIAERVMRSTEEFKTCLVTVLNSFPRKDQANKIKMDILLEDQTSGALRINLPIDDRLMELASLAETRGSLAQEIRLDEYASRFAAKPSDVVVSAIERLIRLQAVNWLSQNFIVEASRNLKLEEIQSLASPSLLMVLVGTNPALAGNRILWERLAGRTHELIDSLAAANISGSDWMTVCCAAIRFEVPNVAWIILDRGGLVVPHAALECLDTLSDYRPPNLDWFVELGKRQEEVFSWLDSKEKLGPATRDGLSLVLDPSAFFLRSRGVSLWAGLEEDTDPRRLAFVFMIACHDRSVQAARIFAKTFSELHLAAKAEALGYQGWLLLQDRLLHLGKFRDWDMCEKLRRFYCHSFERIKWPMEEFWNGFREEDSLRGALKYMIDDKSLNLLARRVLESFESDTIPVWQRTVVDSLARKLRKC